MQTTIITPPVRLDLLTGLLSGPTVIQSTRTINDLIGVFADEMARSEFDPKTEVYTVTCSFPVPDGTEGGLFFGNTFIQPGKVGDEYFMTKGHFHSRIDTAEFYWGIQGEGVLLLMGEDREVQAERMSPGSLHYVPGRVAHRVINTGDSVLSFGACWPSNAGHNYERIRLEGFAAQVICGNDGPVVVGV